MTVLHVGLGVALIGVNLLAGLWGVWSWWRAEPSRAFWPLLRTGQALVMVQAVHGESSSPWAASCPTCT